jgi:hypothetical protein
MIDENNGRRDHWNGPYCPKMKLQVPGRDTPKAFCLEHCVRKPSTEDLRACNPVESGSYGGTTI